VECVSVSLRLLKLSLQHSKMENSFWKYYTHESDWTDGDGWVTFEKSNVINDRVTIDIYFKHELLGKGVRVEDGDTFSYTYNY
jgi:hypothetical protein